MKRVLLQSAYVLHRRAYRETSFLVELFTPDHGRLTLIAKGVRKPRSTTQGLLQSFTPLTVSWCGKGELMTLTSVEAKAPTLTLRGDCLFAGLYLNELLMYLLQKWDVHTALFERYEATLMALHAGQLEEKTLRSFEACLLRELGYGLLPTSELDLQRTFVSELSYRFVPEQGFVLCGSSDVVTPQSAVFSGKSLIAIAQENWCDEQVMQDAKRLVRYVLSILLGGRRLQSRKLFS